MKKGVRAALFFAMRVVKWAGKQAMHGFQGVTGSFN